MLKSNSLFLSDIEDQIVLAGYLPSVYCDVKRELAPLRAMLIREI